MTESAHAWTSVIEGCGPCRSQARLWQSELLC